MNIFLQKIISNKLVQEFFLIYSCENKRKCKGHLLSAWYKMK
jgi:hypothetical protein